MEREDAIERAAVMAAHQMPTTASGMPHPSAVMASQYAHSQPQLHYQHVQKQQLQAFWQQHMQEIEQVSEFRTHQLPLARIKKIMKSDEDVKMIAAEAPVLFAKACEMFILELTLHSWIHTEENKWQTLQRNDIAGAITRGDIFDFLVDSSTGRTQGEAVPYGNMYYPAQPMHHPMAAPEMMVAQPAVVQTPRMMYQPPEQGQMQ